MAISVPGSIDRDISDRIELLRYLLVFAIVYVHIPFLPGHDYPASFEFIRRFIADGVSRAAVPLLTLISGYLLFAAGLDRDFRILLRKKTRSLLVPMVLCNGVLILCLYLLQAGDHWTPHFRNYFPVSPREWVQGIFALTELPANPPLYFLRDLFVVALFAPLFSRFLRHAPLIGLLLLLVNAGLDLDGGLLFRRDIAVNFYIGGLIATQGWDLRKLDRHGAVLFGLFLLICLGITIAQMQRPLWFQLLAPILIWPGASILLHTRLGGKLAAMGRYSFFLFLTHAIILCVLWRACYQFGPGEVYWLLFWLLAPVASAIIAEMLYLLMQRFSRRLLELVTGRAVRIAPRGDRGSGEAPRAPPAMPGG